MRQSGDLQLETTRTGSWVGTDQRRQRGARAEQWMLAVSQVTAELNESLGDITRKEDLEGWTQKMECEFDEKEDAGEKGPATKTVRACGHCQSKCLSLGITAVQPQTGQEALDM
ncbi:hypothetical protein UY3_00496 [Chelonia mydas]|uniref:Uncharacterized protein n=1 Tax=Chelonia mydas TaxID=8469 RepID=M7BWN9_CHEMY|nr:hypothetical protein UY3_00496 [Chelonia mydas]